MILELFVIGLVAGFLFYELTGFSPGGIIAPAYIALFIREPGRIGMTVLIAVIVYLCIRSLSSWLILYGRRKFIFAILLGFFFKLGVTLLIQPLPAMNLDLQSIGYIIPGLIAHEMGRQKPLPTLLSLAIVSMIVFQISQIIP